MKRTVLIHTFGGVMLGMILFISPEANRFSENFPLILACWGAFGAVLLYESLRPYYPALDGWQMVAMLICWGLVMSIAYFLGIFPLVCGVPLTVIILVAAVPRLPAGRTLGVLIFGTVAFCAGVWLLFQLLPTYRFTSLGFAAVLVTGLLGMAFGIGVHGLASWLQPDARRYPSFEKFKPAQFARRDQFFLTDAEYDSYEAARIAAQRDLAAMTQQEGNR